METRLCSGCGSRKSIRGIWYLVSDPAEGEGDDGAAPLGGADGELASAAGGAPHGPRGPGAGGAAEAAAGRGALSTAFMCEQCFHGAATTPYDARLDPGVWG